jgi:secreted PhoX family phosphatase
MPDNLALDRAGNLYIAEDPGGDFAGGKRRGDDIWVATPNQASAGPATSVVRFATLTDCESEPTGLYFDLHSNALFVNAQHRGGDRLDKTMAIFEAKHE